MPTEETPSPQSIITDQRFIRPLPGDIPWNPGPLPSLEWFSQVYGLKEEECHEPLPANFYDLGDVRTVSDFWHWCRARYNALRITEAAEKAGRFYWDMIECCG
jgi:hypothetical protein